MNTREAFRFLARIVAMSFIVPVWVLVYLMAVIEPSDLSPAFWPPYNGVQCQRERATWPR